MVLTNDDICYRLSDSLSSVDNRDSIFFHDKYLFRKRYFISDIVFNYLNNLMRLILPVEYDDKIETMEFDTAGTFPTKIEESASSPNKIIEMCHSVIDRNLIY